MNCAPTVIAYRKPEQTAATSNAGPLFRIPSLDCTMHAVDGLTRSGVDVARITASMSSGDSLAF
jgi:hypothetical protein